MKLIYAFSFILTAIFVQAQGIPPSFSKNFVPSTVETNGVSTLTFTMNNFLSMSTASSLDFTDNLPAGMVVANPANVSTTCVGGTITAVPGSSVITYAGGSIFPGASCTLSVDVTPTQEGVHVNVTGNLTSSLGISGPAFATLIALPAPPPPAQVPTLSQ